MKIALLIFMIFAHITDDYYLQGWLASAKTKKWREKNAPDKLYSKDYIMALFCHSLSWSIMVFLPILIYSLYNQIDLNWFYLVLPINLIIHAIIDDLKANKFKINLIIDQSIHFIQIYITWLMFVLFY
ncbi:MAG: DUF3307 domain-containing protein [Clostridiales bacterium]|nr:DUF3307 domain-containing protein [Clostridiales bacterium]